MSGGTPITYKQTFHPDEFDITHLIEEALAIPDGMHVDVYFDPEKYNIFFSSPFRQFVNIHNESADPNNIQRYSVGKLAALRIDEFAGLKQVGSGGLTDKNTVEVDVESKFYDAFADCDKEVVVGKYYEQAIYIGWNDAIDRIANYLINYNSADFMITEMKNVEERRYCYHIMRLYEKIMERADGAKTRKLIK